MSINTEMHKFNEAVLESTMQAVSNTLWAQDQADRFMRAFLDQGKVTRDEGKALLDRMTDQVRANQESLQRLVHASVGMSLEAMRIPRPGQVEELNRKVEELTRQVQELKGKGK